MNCQLCGENFSYPLKSIIDRHDGQRRQACELCAGEWAKLDRLEEIRKRHTDSVRLMDTFDVQSTAVDDMGFLLDLVDAQQTKLDILLPAAQQVSRLLDALRKDTPWAIAIGLRELYQSTDENFTAAIEAVTK